MYECEHYIIFLCKNKLMHKQHIGMTKNIKHE